jgi:hypothetical protein
LNLFLKLLGYRPRKYSGDGLSVEIKSLVREGILVIYKRSGMSLNLIGERTGRKWETLQVEVPRKDDVAQVSQIAADLERAFRAMDYEYDISSGLETLARSKK